MLLLPRRTATWCCSFALMIVGTACGSAKAPVEPSTVARTGALRRIVVLGDSLAVSPSRTDAFPARLQERLDAAYPGWIVGNEGVGGDTTSDGLQRLDRALSEGTAILILELGANDGLRGNRSTPLKRTCPPSSNGCVRGGSPSCCAEWKRHPGRVGTIRSSTTDYSLGWPPVMKYRSCLFSSKAWR